ncbi:MAG: hypothetical protein ACJ8AH_21260, partial [Stellaceae bacterium]
DPYCWLFAAFSLNTAMRHQEILTEMLLREREMRSYRAGWIFPSPHRDSGTGHRARMDIAFCDAVARAGLDPKQVTPHVMSHTAITKLVQAGSTCQRSRRSPDAKRCVVLRDANVQHRPSDPDDWSGAARTAATRQVARLHRNYKETLATA